MPKGAVVFHVYREYTDSGEGVTHVTKITLGEDGQAERIELGRRIDLGNIDQKFFIETKRVSIIFRKADRGPPHGAESVIGILRQPTKNIL